MENLHELTGYFPQHGPGGLMYTGANVHVTPVVPLIHLHQHAQQRNPPPQHTHPHICDLEGFIRVQIYLIFVIFL